MDELRVRVESVKETPKRWLLETTPSWWERARDIFQAPNATANEPFAVDMEAYRLGERLLFRGGVAGTVELSCSRCAEPYPHRFQEPLELLLEPARDPSVVPATGIELDGQDLQLGRYAGDELNFEPVVLEILALVWPMQPLCSDDCKGLCQECGRNLNKESCACRPEAANRPFAGLARLLGSRRR
ncbi:MAG: DUF177 domain-containing protein [Myxococcota bacterium]